MSTFRSSLKLCPLLALAATAAFAGPARAELKIVATVPDLAAVARGVGGPRSRSRPVSADPGPPLRRRQAQPRARAQPRRSRAARRPRPRGGLAADVAGWRPQPGHPERGSPRYLDCSQFVHKLDSRSGTVDRSQGDIHPHGNPHYLYDPRAAGAVARGIAERLGRDGFRATRAPTRPTSRLPRSASTPPVPAGRSALPPFRGAPVIGYHKHLELSVRLAGPRPGRLPRSQSPACRRTPARGPTAGPGPCPQGARRAPGGVLPGRDVQAPSPSRIPATLFTIPAATNTNVPAGQTYVQRIDVMLVASLADALEKGAVTMRPDAREGASGGPDLLRCEDLALGHHGRSMLPPDRRRHPARHMLAVVGRNGSGKSTWFKTVLGFLPAVGGAALAVHDPPPRLAYMAQASEVEAWCRCGPAKCDAGSAVGLELPSARPGPEPGEAVRARAGGRWRRPRSRAPSCATSPKGQTAARPARPAARRPRPTSVFLDEPTAAMDAVAEQRTMALLRECRANTASPSSSSRHLLGLARRYADEVLYLDRDDGVAVWRSPPTSSSPTRPSAASSARSTR